MLKKPKICKTPKKHQEETLEDEKHAKRDQDGVERSNLDLPQHLNALPDLRREGLQHIGVLPCQALELVLSQEHIQLQFFSKR